MTFESAMGAPPEMGEPKRRGSEALAVAPVAGVAAVDPGDSFD